jgi:hypothetical protein
MMSPSRGSRLKALRGEVDHRGTALLELLLIGGLILMTEGCKPVAPAGSSAQPDRARWQAPVMSSGVAPVAAMAIPADGSSTSCTALLAESHASQPAARVVAAGSQVSGLDSGSWIEVQPGEVQLLLPLVAQSARARSWQAWYESGRLVLAGVDRGPLALVEPGSQCILGWFQHDAAATWTLGLACLPPIVFELQGVGELPAADATASLGDQARAVRRQVVATLRAPGDVDTWRAAIQAERESTVLLLRRLLRELEQAVDRAMAGEAYAIALREGRVFDEPSWCEERMRWIAGLAAVRDRLRQARVRLEDFAAPERHRELVEAVSLLEALGRRSSREVYRRWRRSPTAMDSEEPADANQPLSWVQARLVHLLNR